MKKIKSNSYSLTFRYILAGVIVVSVTLAMLAVSQFILSGKIQLFSYTLVG